MLKVLSHHIYEYKKGLRRMVLYTSTLDKEDKIVQKLKCQKISYFITYPGEKNLNVFFGDPTCIEVIKSFQPTNLTALSLEEDFILGAVLGYDIKVQCKRYIKRLNDTRKKTA